MNTAENDPEVLDGAISLPSSQPLPRSGWDEIFAKAAEAGYAPDSDMFDGISNAFDQTEWEW